MFFIDRRRWNRQPSVLQDVDWSHPLAKHLIVAIVPGLEPRELVGGKRGWYIDANTIIQYQKRGAVLECPNTSTAGMWFEIGPRMLEWGSEWSIACAMQVDAWAHSSSFLSVPYRDGTWSDPWSFLNFGRNGWDNRMGLGFQTSLTTRQTTLWDYNPEAQPRQEFAMASSVARSEHYLVANRSVKTLFSSATEGPNWAASDRTSTRFAIMNRSGDTPGEGTDGQMEFVFVFKSFIPRDVLVELTANPYQLLRPRKRMMLFDHVTAPSGPSNVTREPTGHSAPVTFGSASVSSTVGTSSPYSVSFYECERIATGGAQALYRLPTGFYFVRNGTVYDVNDRNQLQAYGTNVPVWNADGLRHEDPVTNAIRNSDFVGAVAGTPGTLPTGYAWTGAWPSQSVKAVGTENGVPYIEFSFHATNTGTSSFLDLEFLGRQVQQATVGQTWTGSYYIKPVGRMSHVPQLNLSERDSAGSWLAETTQSGFTSPGKVTRVTCTRTLTSASCAYILPRLRFTIGSGELFSCHFRVYLPQLERSTGASSGIRTAGTVQSRAQETLWSEISPGSYSKYETLWMNEYTGTVDKQVVNSPVAVSGGYILPRRTGFRLREAALAQTLSTAYTYTTTPKTTIQSAVSGQKIIVRPGVYYDSSIGVPSNVEVIGTCSTFFEGAREFYDWVWNGSRWTRSAGVEPMYVGAESSWFSGGRSDQRSDLYINGVMQNRKTGTDQLFADGEWFMAGVWDSEGNYVAQAPYPITFRYPNSPDLNALDVRISTESGTFRPASGPANNVTLRNLRMFRHTVNAQRGSAVDPFLQPGGFTQETTGWKVIQCTAEGDHIAAITVTNQFLVDKCWIIGAGGCGVHGGFFNVRRYDMTIRRCYIANCNAKNMDTEHDAGGIKLLWTTRSTIRENEIANNQGRGVWYDWYNENTTVEHNYIHGNMRMAYDLEACDGTWGAHKFRYNVVNGNNTDYVASDPSNSTWAADLLIRSSKGCLLEYNQITSDKGPGWIFAYRGNVSITSSEHEFRYNEVICLDATSNRHNGFINYGGTTAEAQGMRDCRVHHNTYRATANSNVAWNWINSSLAQVPVVYTSLPDNNATSLKGENASTFNIAGNAASYVNNDFYAPYVPPSDPPTPPGEGEPPDIFINVQPLIAQTGFGEPTVEGTGAGQVLSQEGLNLIPIDFGTAAVFAQGGVNTVLASGLAVSVSFGTPGTTPSQYVGHPEGFQVDIDFAVPDVLQQLFPETPGSEFMTGFGNPRVKNPQPKNFKTTFTDVGPSSRS